MTIPSNIYWQTAQKKTNFQAVVVFTQGEKYLGIITSLCWEDELKSCAESVLAEARTSLQYEFKKPNLIRQTRDSRLSELWR